MFMDNEKLNEELIEQIKQALVEAARRGWAHCYEQYEEVLESKEVLRPEHKDIPIAAKSNQSILINEELVVIQNKTKSTIYIGIDKNQTIHITKEGE